MNVRNAVATTQQAPAEVTPAQMIARAVEVQSEAFKSVLPKMVDPDRFSRLVLSAVKSTPQLMECFGTAQGKTSVLLAAMDAAAMGLEPNTPTQECWLLPRRNRGVVECQLSIGYRGYLRLARRSGTLKTVYAEVVHAGDHFTWGRGLEDDTLEFRPSDDADPGELTHVFAVARFTNGGYSFVVLNRRQVEARRAMSDSWKNEKARPYSPWTKWTEEMWKKTAIRALVPSMDLSPEVATHAGHDDARLELSDDGVIEATYIEPDPEPVAELAQPTPADQPADVIDAPSESSPAAPAGDAPSEQVPPPAVTTGAAPATGSAAGPGATSPDEPATDGQSRVITKILKDKHGLTGDERFPKLAALLGRELGSIKEMSVSEAGTVIEQLQTEAA